jgi:UDP-GlcNAc:undecaprenyl-phosphate GlcNAc-1-phosphate transferase
MPFAIAALVTFVLMPLARRLGSVVGLVDRPSPGILKIHRQPVPLTGGLAVILGVLASMWSVDPHPESLPALSGAVLLALVVGLVDDARSLTPSLRVAVLILAGALLSGALTMPGTGAIRLGIAMALVLACSNAVNLIDGQDGLAGGVLAIGAAGLAVAGERSDLADVSSVGWALCAALLIFLLWNRPPARVFLGNGGAYAVGVVVAFQSARLVTEVGWPGLLAAAACLGMPAFELASTVARRVASRTPLAGGDRLHSYDLLAVRTRSRATSTLLIVGAQAVLTVLGIIAIAVPSLTVALASSLAVIAVVGSIFHLHALRSHLSHGGGSGDATEEEGIR